MKIDIRTNTFVGNYSFYRKKSNINMEFYEKLITCQSKYSCGREKILDFYNILH